MNVGIAYASSANRAYRATFKDVHSVISFGVGRSNDERVEHELFDDSDAWRESEMGAYRQKAATQLGTVGSGNHFVA